MTLIVGASAVGMLITVNMVGQAEIRQRYGERGGTYLLYLMPKYVVVNTKARGLLDNTDLAVLAEQMPQINAIALWDSRTISDVELKARAGSPSGAIFTMQAMLSRVTPALKDVMGLGLTQGRFINDVDLQRNRSVCVIGARLHKRLGGRQVIGKQLSINMIVSDGTRPIRVTETYTIVGVLQAELPLLAALPLDDKALWHIVPSLVDMPRSGHPHGMPGIKAFQALQREQLAFGRLAINDTVFIPWKGDDRALSLAPDTLVYLSVSVPAVPVSRIQVLDQETMIAEQAMVTVDPCEKCPDALCALNQISHYMPQELMNVIDELRTVLRARLGDGKLFQFLHLEALGDPIRFDLRWLNRLLGAIILTCLVLCLISIVSVVVLSKITVSDQETAEASGVLSKHIRPNCLTIYSRICLFSVAFAVIASSLFSYWLVTMVLLW
ncbi:MAG: ABC transporter permease [Dethiobacter sp.]|nr:ABC transporter permease [Dethiobacter sp.]